MDTEKRAADWPIKPGRIIGHSIDGMTPYDVAVEVGLTSDASLYIGEVASETLADYGVKVPFAGWWICIRTETELRPVALTCQGADGDEAGDLARIIAQAVTEARTAAATEEGFRYVVSDDYLPPHMSHKVNAARDAFVTVIDEEIATARSVGMIGAATVLVLNQVKRRALAALDAQVAVAVRAGASNG